MSLIASLDVAIRGNTSNVDKAFTDTERRLSSFKSKVESSGKSSNIGAGWFSSLKSAFSPTALGGLFGGLQGAMSGAIAGPLGLVASAVGSILGKIKEQITQAFVDIGNISKGASRLGIGTESFSGLAHGASVVGISTEELSGHLEHFERTLAEMASGQAPQATAALAKMGLSINDLSNMPLDAALAKWSDGLNSLGSSGDKLLAIRQFFGRGGSEMMDLLKGGSAGLASFNAEAERLGLSVSGDKAAAVKEYNRSWAQIGEALKGVGRTIATALLPYLTQLVNWLKEVFESIAEWVNGSHEYWEAFRDTVLAVWEAIKGGISAAWDFIKSIFSGIGEALGLNMGTWESWKMTFLKACWTAQYVFKNFKEFILLDVDLIKLAFVTFYNTLEHLFTTLIPAVLNALLEFVGTAFKNLGNNIKDNAKALWNSITPGDNGAEFVWHPLAEGWDKAMKDIRDKAKREPGELEKELQKSVADRAKNLAVGLADYINQKLGEFGSGAGGKPGGKKGPEQGVFNAITGTFEANKKLGAAEAGSAEAFSIIAHSQGDKMFNATNDILKENKKANDKLDKLIRQLIGVPLVKAKL